MTKQEPCRVAKTAWRRTHAKPRYGSLTSRVGSCGCGALLLLAATTAHAEWSLSADAGAFHDSNLTRAASRMDMRSDSAATLAMTATWPVTPTESDRLTFGAGAGGEVYRRYHGLDNASALGTAAYRHKFGVGFGAPWVLLEADARYYRYDVNLRSGPRYALRAASGKRLSETFDVEGGAFVDRRRSPYGGPDFWGLSGKVFDLRGHGAYLGAGYAITANLFLSARATIRRGDVESTSTGTMQIFSVSTAAAEDSAFGDELYAYRLRGTTGTGALMASWALSDRSSINLAYTGEHTSAANDLAYHSHVVDLTFTYAY